MENVIKLLEEKGIIKRLKLTTKIANTIVEELNIKKSDDNELKAILLIILEEATKDEKLGIAIVDYAFEAVAKEILNIINKEEKINE